MHYSKSKKADLCILTIAQSIQACSKPEPVPIHERLFLGVGQDNFSTDSIWPKSCLWWAVINCLME